MHQFRIWFERFVSTILTVDNVHNDRGGLGKLRRANVCSRIWFSSLRNKQLRRRPRGRFLHFKANSSPGRIVIKNDAILGPSYRAQVFGFGFDDAR